MLRARKEILTAKEIRRCLTCRQKKRLMSLNDKKLDEARILQEK